MCFKSDAGCVFCFHKAAAKISFGLELLFILEENRVEYSSSVSGLKISHFRNVIFNDKMMKSQLEMN